MQTQGNKTQIEDILKEYESVIKQKNGIGTIQSDLSRIRSIDELLVKNKTSITKLLQEAIETDDSYKYAMDEFGKITFPVSDKTLASWKKAYKKIVLFVLGQYDANYYYALMKEKEENDKKYCEFVAKYALFCKVEIAEKVKNGKLGSRINGKEGGNDYYSWSYCMFQRGKKKGQNTGKKVNGIYDIKYDDNTKANEAIKSAISKGLTIKLKKAKFDGYMVCHIWDDTCHNNLFHTSVFNLVLLPQVIGGLSDYSPAVKDLLQYEAAMRFGVYPANYNGFDFSKSGKPEYYDEVDSLWRQQEEHQKAKNRNEKPKALQ